MAIEQESSPGDPDLKMLRRSAIENEIPTYRAVSTRAVFATICGLLAGLSFTHPVFYLFAAAAVILGFSADRAIQRYPDLLTGRGLARAGVALGLIFGLSIYTITSVQTFLFKRQVAEFAREYARILKESSLADAYWVSLSPNARAHVTPEENMKQMQDKREEAAMTEMKFAGVRNLSTQLHASPESTITFKGIEDHGSEDLVLVALALFDVHVGPIPHKHEEGEEEGHEHDHDHADEGPRDLHAMATIKGYVPEGKDAYEWWVEDLTYPYQPKTGSLPTPKAVDDGHGHAH